MEFLMPDREKVIATAIEQLDWYFNEDDGGAAEGVTKIAYQNLKESILALLKEQDEGVTPIESTTEQKKFAERISLAVSDFWCGACRFNLVGHPKFCPNCGKKVKWEDD